MPDLPPALVGALQNLWDHLPDDERPDAEFLIGIDTKTTHSMCHTYGGDVPDQGALLNALARMMVQSAADAGGVRAENFVGQSTGPAITMAIICPLCTDRQEIIQVDRLPYHFALEHRDGDAGSPRV